MVALSSLLVTGCVEPVGLSSSDSRVQVVTTTGILRDLVSNVGGDRVRVTSLIPDSADPHTYEPSLRSVRDVVYADVAFSNYLLLEQQSLIRTLDANLPTEAKNVSLAEASVAYSAKLIPLVEDLSLDTLWLGLRVIGGGSDLGADRGSVVRLSAVDVKGPGRLVAYVTGSFGQPEVLFDSGDGFDRSDGFDADTALLPTAAHTHLSWVFTEPGVYRLSLESSLVLGPTDRPVPIAEGDLTVAVGVDPPVAVASTPVLVDSGHADVAVDLDRSAVVVRHDAPGADEPVNHQLGQVVLSVPNRAIQEVPADPAFRFLGRPGDRVFQLAQAVLGRHIHGEIDPHLWHDIDNVMAYVNIIRDTLTEVDPAGAGAYRDAAARYVRLLESLNQEITAELAPIPDGRRQLITTHDSFRYFANDHSFEIAGFVSPNPATEPSLSDRRRLTETIRNLNVPAVFLEPNLIARSTMLRSVAEAEGIDVCPILGDVFTSEVRTYIELMRFNARSIRRCLSP